jgi:hypothetical protein
LSHCGFDVEARDIGDNRTIWPPFNSRVLNGTDCTDPLKQGLDTQPGSVEINDTMIGQFTFPGACSYVGHSLYTHNPRLVIPQRLDITGIEPSPFFPFFQSLELNLPHFQRVN